MSIVTIWPLAPEPRPRRLAIIHSRAASNLWDITTGETGITSETGLISLVPIFAPACPLAAL